MSKITNLIDVDQLSQSQVEILFKLADIYLKKPNSKILENKKLLNLFFENSTRTRSSFEIAAKNMGAEVVNINVSTSALKKGESEKDTILTLNAMGVDFITIRHSESGMVEFLSKYSEANVINSGDGAHAHPTQALLDCFTIYKEKKLKKISDFKKLKIAICGDIINSRVARSNIKLMTMLGSKIHLIGPNTLVPKYIMQKNIKKFTDLKKGLKDVDVVLTLRIQKERMKSCFIPSFKEYFKYYGISEKTIKYAKKDTIVLHPGPMNRDIEISEKLADNVKICKVLEQVRNGVAVRQGVLEFLS